MTPKLATKTLQARLESRKRFNPSAPLYAKYLTNPLGYCSEVLGVNLWSKQQEIFTKLLEPPYRVLCRAGHNVGKSFLGACFASWFYNVYNPSICLVTAPRYDSIKDLLFADLRRIHPNKSEFLPQDSKLRSSDEHYVYGITSATGEGFHGRHKRNLALIYEEATGIKPNYFEVGKTMFTGDLGHYWLALLNPTDPNSQIYHEESTGNWHIVQISQFDHPNVIAELRGEKPPYPDAVRLQQVIDQMDEYGERISPSSPHVEGEVSLTPELRWIPGPLADCRVLGRWPQSGGDSVWSEAIWQKMVANRVEVNPLWRVQIGCDVARYGYDDTTIMVKQGVCLLHSERHNGWSLKQTCQRLKELAHKYKGPHNPRELPILIDGAGIGAGVVDYGDDYNFVSVLGITAAQQEEKYYNTRCELWFNTVEQAKEGLIDVSRLPAAELTRLKAECTSVTYDLDPRSRYRVESKLATRAKIKRSPDLADAFNLTCYWIHR